MGTRFAAANLDKSAGGPEYARIVDALAEDDRARTDFLKACLGKLGLQVAQSTTTVPSLSSLHLSGLDPADTEQIVSSLGDIITTEGQEEYVKDENDTFRLEKAGTWSMGTLNEALPDSSEGIVDYSAITKRIVVHDEVPSSKTTPYFNHHAFYSNLRRYQSLSKEGASEFGANLMYGEVVTSTNTILEK